MARARRRTVLNDQDRPGMARRRTPPRRSKRWSSGPSVPRKRSSRSSRPQNEPSGSRRSGSGSGGLAGVERRIVKLEGQRAQTEEASSELAAIRSRFAEQSAAQERAGAEITAASEEVARITASMGDLAGNIGRVLQLTEHMDRVDEVNAKL